MINAKSGRLFFDINEFTQKYDEHFILSCPECNCPVVTFDSVDRTKFKIALKFKTSCEHEYFYLCLHEASESVVVLATVDKKSVDYHEYIMSAAWKAKALRAKERAGWRCQVCNRSQDESLTLDAHHRTYERLGNELPEDITVLCRDCHELYESNKKKNK